MDDALVHNWNQRVAPTDTVWLLGDVAMSARGLENVSRLHGYKILVAGNHDSCHEMHKRWRRAERDYLEAGINLVVPQGYKQEHYVNDRPGGPRVEVNLSHFPYAGAGDHTATERYTDWRLRDLGVPLLCGHVHDAWLTKETAQGTPMINVGVDVWGYAPVAAATLGLMLRG